MFKRPLAGTASAHPLQPLAGRTGRAALRPWLGALAVLAAVAWHPAPAQAAGLECAGTRCAVGVTRTLAIEADATAFFEVAGRIELSGDATIRTPAGTLPLLGAELVFQPRPDLPEVAFELYGTAKAPFPALPLFAGSEFRAQPYGAVGLVTRETLKGLLESPDSPLPLAENPRDPNGDPDDLLEPAYLFFHFASGLSLDMPLGQWLGLNQEPGAHNPFEFSVPGDKSATFILDPTEPYFFLSQDARQFMMDTLTQAYQQAADMNELERQREQQQAAADGQDPATTDGTPQTAGNGDTTDPNTPDQQQDGSLLPELGSLAFSWLGGIPFAPRSTWGLDADVGRFKGQLYLDSTVPLYKFVEIDGEVVTYIGEDGIEQGGNGNVQVAFDLIPNFLSLSFPLGHASAGVKITADEQAAYFSGINSPDLSFLPPIIPFVPSNATLVAGYVSSAYPASSHIVARGEFTYDTSGLRALTGLELGNLAVTEADLYLGVDGVRVTGRTGSNLHPALMINGAATVDVFFSPTNPAASFIDLRGDMMVAGVGLTPVRVRVDASGLHLEGRFVTPISSIAMTGQITKAGPSLSGAADLSFPLGAFNRAMDKARAGVIAAQGEVARLQGVVDHMRGVVSAERQVQLDRLRAAEAAVNGARSHVNSLQSAISGHYSAISTYRSQISSKYRWYKGQPWYKKSWAWGVYAAYAASKNASIAWRYGQIGALNAAKSTALGALTVAEATLRGIQAALPAIPVDADPRVAGPIAALVTARAALEAAELALPDLPDIAENVGGNLSLALDLGGLRGTVSAVIDGRSIANGTLRFGVRPEACITVGPLGTICAPF